MAEALGIRAAGCFLTATETFGQQDSSTSCSSRTVASSIGFRGPLTVTSSHISRPSLSLRNSWGSTHELRRGLSSRSVRRQSHLTVEAVASPARTTQETQVASQLAREKRADFPILEQDVGGHPLVYLDNAATSQKPRQVVEALRDYYYGYNSNVHRGVHALSAKATTAYEDARAKVARFVNAPSCRDIIFTRNASEAINLVAYTWGLENIKEGDEILLSVMEHHSNLVPWQLLAKRTGATLRFVQLDANEGYSMEHFKQLLNAKTKLVACNHVSNMLGCINPVQEIAELAHAHGAKVLVDACQSVPHMPVDVQSLGVDWLVASSHKMCGPTGVGFLYGRSDILASMPPFLGGGEMIRDVFLEYSTFADAPNRFEAGTPAIGEVIALGAAVDYLMEIGMDRIHHAEMELSKYLHEKVSAIPDVRIYGPLPGADGSQRAALCTFNVEGIHPTDISTFLDEAHGVAIRSGHHCTQPLHRHLGISASGRSSVYFYNTVEEIDIFIEAFKDTISFFKSVPS